MAFDLSKAIGLKQVSKLDTAQMQEIAVSLLDPNPNNFFEVESDITDLCESIKVNGLLQPPVVTPAGGGKYRIIAGHRRHKALQALAEELPDKFGTVLCRVVHPSSPELEELMLIQTNTEAREIGWREKNEAATRVEKILVVLKNQGMELPGKMRSHVAKLIKTSESQIARAKYIAEHLIEPLRSASGISDSVAYKLAHLPDEQQFALHDHYKPRLYMLDQTCIDRYLENIKEGREPFYVPPPAPRLCYTQGSKDGVCPPCVHTDVIQKRSKRKLPSYQKCGSCQCCSYCDYRYDCEDVCSIVSHDLARRRATETYRICRALRSAREQKGLSVEDTCEALNISAEQLLAYENTQIHTVHSLKTLCDLYDTTPNRILGFDDVSDIAAQHAWVPADQIGDLPDGLYFMLYAYSKPYTCENGKALVRTRAVLRRENCWHLTPSGKPWTGRRSEEKLVAVLPAPPIPETWSLMFESLSAASDEVEDE